MTDERGGASYPGGARHSVSFEEIPVDMGYRVWRDNQGEKRTTIRMRIDVATGPRVT